MKRLLTTFVFVFVGVLLCPNSFAICDGAPGGPATPNYSTYDSLSVDGSNNVYFDMSVAGWTTGNQQCMGGATHTLQVISQMPGGDPVTVQQAGVSPWYYYTVSSSQSFVAQPGTVYSNIGYTAKVLCQAVGIIFLALITTDVELAYTKSQTDFSNAITNTHPADEPTHAFCALLDYCTPDTSPPLCSPSTVDASPSQLLSEATCYQYYTSFWLADRPHITMQWNCILPDIPEVGNATGTTDNSLLACTKAP